MNFNEFAEYLEKLEGTSSRLEMTRILAEMFREAGEDDAKIMAYMSAGMLGPKYNSPDFGMADKQVIKAIARVTDEDVLRIFKREGDLGKTAEIVKEKSKSEIGLKVKEVFKRLVDVAEVSGTGSQEEKIRLLSDLLTELDARSAKFAVKIVLGKMRGGFSDMTVLDALSWMVTGDKNLRPDIERIYNVRADLGEVVKIVKRSGNRIKSVGVRPEIGTPILVARCERAETIAEIWERNGESAAEHKLDGLRIQAHIGKSVKLFSRGLDDVTSMYPDIVEGLKKQVRNDCILDGEMIAVDETGKYLPFQETMQRKRKYDILEMMKSVPLKYFVFDILFAEGKSWLERPNLERWEKLGKEIASGGTVKLMPRKIVKSENEIEKFFKAALAEGTEGVVVKKLDGIYRSGSRDFNWIKYKKSYDATGVADTLDAVVLGYDLGEGKRSGFGIGGFLIGVRSGESDKYVTVAKIGTGLRDDEWRQLKVQSSKLKVQAKPENYEVSKQMNCDVWIRPEIVVEIKSDEITKSPMHTSGYALRFPRLVSFREMKVEEIASKKEVERLFELQRGGENNGG